MRLKELSKSKEWYLYRSRHFRRIKGKPKLKNGALLFHHGNFYIVTQNRKLKRIPDSLASKFILKKIKHSMTKTDLKVIQQILDFIFEINDNGDIQLTLAPPLNASYHTLPPRRRYRRDKYPPEAEEKARKLFYQSISSYSCFSLRRPILYIYSKNKRTYQISLHNGSVYTSCGHSVCVAVRGSLPYYDRILAKALTIAYSPQRIGTL